MVRKILLSLLVLLIMIGAGSYFYLDSIVRRGIEVVGSSVLGTNVTVSAVALSPLNGSGGITDLRIQNPQGFNAEYIFELGYVSINLEINSLLSDVIEIESVTIAQPVITYETRVTTDNIRALLANLPGGAADPAPAPATDGASKQFIIRELQILNPQLTLAAGGLSAPVQLPDIVLVNIGTEAGAATVAEVLRVILTALRASILQADLPGLELLRDSIENSVQEAVDQADQAIDSAVENLGNRLRQLGN